MAKIGDSAKSPAGPPDELPSEDTGAVATESLFNDAIAIFEEEASEREKNWLKKQYKHQENRPPRELESFRAYIWSYDEELKQKKLVILYDHLSAFEGLIRGFGTIVDCVLKMLPEPYASPINLVFGIIKFTFRTASNYVETMENMAEDLTWILEKLSETEWWLESYKQNEHVVDAAKALYVSVLKFWCQAWHSIKKHRSVKIRMLNLFKTHDDAFRGLQKEIGRRMDHLNTAVMRDTFKILIDGKKLEKLRDRLRCVKETMTPSSHQGNTNVTDSYRKWMTRLLRLHFPGTCDWLQKETTFQSWEGRPQESAPNVLWVHAIPGAGKSVMAAFVIHQLLTRASAGGDRDTTLYFFCRHDNLAQCSAEEVVKSLLLQVARQYCPSDHTDKVDDRILSLLENITSDDLANVEDPTLENPIRLKVQALLAELAGRGTVRLIIDGLDELENFQACRVLAFLSQMSGTEHPLAALLVFSRNEQFLKDEFEQNSIVAPYTEIKLPGPQLLSDLRIFAEARLQQKFQALLPQSTDQERDNEVQRIVTMLLTTKVNSNAPPFLWVTHMLIILNEDKSVPEMEKDLVKIPYLPDALYTAYARILIRIEMTLSEKELGFLSHVLTWMTYSSDNISVSQLRALSLVWNIEDYQSPEELRARILNSCRSLVVFRKNTNCRLDDTLHYFHYSMKEFLSQDRSRIMAECDKYNIFYYGNWPRNVFHGILLTGAKEAHKSIFIDCLRYLTDTYSADKTLVFDKPLVPCRGDPVFARDISASFPLLEYAAKFWPLHMTNTKELDPPTIRRELDRFFGLKQCHTWMEAAIAYHDGIHWLFMQKAVIQVWLDDPRHKGPPCPHFHRWAEDISNRGFRNHEVTLRYNPNDVHYLDARMLFPRSFCDPGYVQEGRDSIVPLSLRPGIVGLAKSRSFASDLNVTNRTGTTIAANDEEGQNRDLMLPPHLDLGEYNTEYGFVSQDHGRPGHRGVFLIDKFTNHPRLSWVCKSPPEPVEGDSLGAVAVMERRFTGIKKHNYHKLWMTLSCAMYHDGTRLAGLFGETVEAKGNSPAVIRMMPVIWEFRGLDDEYLRHWKADLGQARAKFQRAAESILRHYNAPRPLQRRKASELEAARRQLHSAMDRRPVVPTRALFINNKWATVWKVLMDTEDFVHIPELLSSRYLLAFGDKSQTLVMPRGLYSLLQGQYLVRYPDPKFENQFVVLPTGEEILTFDDTRTKLEMRSPANFVVHRMILAHSFGEDYERFGAIIDCSQTGRIVCLTLVAKSNGTLAIALVDLLEWTFKIVMRKETDGSDFVVKRAFFCPRDLHMVLICTKKLVEWTAEAHVIDIPRGICQFLKDCTDGVPNAVLYASCGYADRVFGTQGVPLPAIGQGYCHQIEFRHCLYSYYMNERLGLGLAELIRKRPVIEDKSESDSGEEVRSNGASNCGHVALITADRSVELKTTFLNTLAIKKDCAAPSSRSTAALSLHRSFHSISNNGCRVVSGYITIRSGSRVPIDDPNSLFPVVVQIRCAVWNLDPTNCIDKPGYMAATQPIELETDERGLYRYGIKISRSHSAVAWWLGGNLSFLRVNKGQIQEGATDNHFHHVKMQCKSVKLSPDKLCSSAVAIWETPGTDTFVIGSYALTSHSATFKAEFPIQQGIFHRCTYHPNGDLLLITTNTFLLCYNISDLAKPTLINSISLETVRSSMKITYHKNDDGQASPVSTRETLTSEESAQMYLKFSRCGKLLYSQSWDVLALVDDLRARDNIPDPKHALAAFEHSGTTAKSFWASINPNHPRVMHEDVLYAADQQRFKVFRIRANVVLGWAAEGTSLFKMPTTNGHDDPGSQHHGFTWYRRTLCAIPMNLLGWRLAVIWPEMDEQRLFAIMLPPPDDRGEAHPVVIYSRDRVEDLIPDTDRLGKKEGHEDGWIRSHAGGCAYHIRN